MAVATAAARPPAAPSKASTLQTFKGAAWLGWQIESNWAEPWVFAVYSILRPLAGVGIVTFMYIAVTTATAPALNTRDRLAFVYVGTAFFMFVGQELYGISQAVLDDREH